MISYQEALQKVLDNAAPLGAEDITVTKSLGRILAQDIQAEMDVPPFDQSAVDGFAVHAAETLPATEMNPVQLSVRTTVRAGDETNPELGCHEAIKIMTGGRLPAGADAVVMKEDCIGEKETVHIRKPVKPGANVRHQGEEYACGDLVLKKGTRITPPVVGLLSALGYSETAVYVNPRISLVVTGDELLQPGDPLLPGKIYDSNSHSLGAALQESGLECGVQCAGDDENTLRESLSDGLLKSDVLITAGGVSVGEYDLLKGLFRELGVQEIFWGVSIKPGKPVYFGIHRAPGRDRNTLVFGLPGNPVAALLCFHQLVEPGLFKMMGRSNCSRIQIPAKLTREQRKRTNRLEWLRGVATRLNGALVVTPCAHQESHMLGGLAEANCIIEFPADREILHEGETVNVELLEW